MLNAPAPNTFVPLYLQVLFRRVLKGDISPANLSRMSPEELASKELAAWRQRENRHVSQQRFTVQGIAFRRKVQPETRDHYRSLELNCKTTVTLLWFGLNYLNLTEDAGCVCVEGAWDCVVTARLSPADHRDD